MRTPFAVAEFLDLMEPLPERVWRYAAAELSEQLGVVVSYTSLRDWYLRSSQPLNIEPEAVASAFSYAALIDHDPTF